jgi:hypothetical protein
MVKVWLEERLQALIPALEPLGREQEAEIERLCLEELDAWRARPGMKKETSLRPVVTAARKAIKDRIKLTPANRYLNEQKGEYQHLALKYLNLDWEALNAISDEKFEAGLQNQQQIENPRAVVARAESLLQSSRSDELIVALALVTGRRLTELLKSGRFFPKTAYTLVFDGQLKRRDLDLKPYEIPVLVDAEMVLQAWRKLRTLEDCTKLENEAVTQKYSRAASESANRLFAGLIPQESERENLFTHAFRAVYAQIAVHWFCPKYVDEKLYANAILGHFQATTERQRRDYLATLHYQHYYIDGVKGVRLEEPGVPVLEVFQRAKGDRTVSATETTELAQDEAQEQQPVLETKKHKTRGTFTVKPGTYDQGLKIIDERGFEGTGAHDRLLVDLMSHDATAHQMYALLQPLAEELNQDAEQPLALLQALITAYRSGGSAAAPGMAELLAEVSDEEKPVEYLRGLVERDRKFQAAIANRHSKVDYSTASMADLRSKYKTPEAATERFRRAVDAIIRHNEAQTDPLHLWYINAAAVRKLVGGKNELVQAYLRSRQAEIDAHHAHYSLTPKQNDKNMDIASEITVE